RPTDVPRRPAAPRAPVRLPRSERRRVRVGAGWPRRLRGKHVRLPSQSMWVAATMSTTTIAVVLGFVVARAPNAETIHRTVVPKRPTAAAVGPSSTYGQALNRVIKQLNGIRSGAGSRLAVVHKPQAQAAAAQQLATAHLVAAAAVKQLK